MGPDSTVEEGIIFNVCVYSILCDCVQYVRTGKRELQHMMIIYKSSELAANAENMLYTVD